MLDVHPPHESIQTWKAFFVHIATIVIGLLIAVALEQTVEFFHHRHLVAETREALHEEMQKNIAMFHENVERHIMTMAYLHNNLRIAIIRERRRTNFREFFTGRFSRSRRRKQPGPPPSTPKFFHICLAPRSDTLRMSMCGSITLGMRTSQSSHR
jgi:hypothetical protein